MSNPSHKSTSKKARPVQAPQRSNGKMRVAVILKAAAAIIAEKGYEGTTMADIALRSATKIGSLYRFFPNKESLADTIVVSARENVDALFDQLDYGVRVLSSHALADDLMALMLKVFSQRALLRLLDGGQDWSVKREEFRKAMLQRTTKTLMIHTPTLGEKLAADIAVVILLNVKSVVHQEIFDPRSLGVLSELRYMTRLYLQSRLRPAK